jgi:hypothetical protein
LFVGLLASTSAAQEAPPATAPQQCPAAMRITLEEAKERALNASKLLTIGSLNVESKAFAVKAVQADYFPKVTGTALYLHFQDQLGTVLSTIGRRVQGPSGRPLLVFPPTVVNVPVFNQDSSFAMITVLQPVTDLLKVRQGVKIAHRMVFLRLPQSTNVYVPMTPM